MTTLDRRFSTANNQIDMKQEQREIDAAFRAVKESWKGRPRVVDIRYDPYVDSIGDEALSVYVILSEDTPDDDRRWVKVHPIKQAIHDALTARGVYLWPYIRFRKGSELEPAETEG